MTSTKISLYGVVNDSIVDGPGLRYTIFTQGCPHHCQGCHNPESWDENGGYLEDIDHIIADIMKNPLLDGITLSGGEPFLQCQPLIALLNQIKKQTHLHIMIYSGYTYEQIISDQNKLSLLKLGDMLVDGLYVEEKRSLALLYRGSSNQRLINIQESLKQGKVIEYIIDEYGEIEI